MDPTIDINLPLTETTFFILLSISSEPKHGYAIMKVVETLSEGRVRLSTGTLYGALKRLLENSWIKRVHEVDSIGDGQTKIRARKAYGLTEIGHRLLEAEIARMEQLTATARWLTSGSKA